MKRVFTKVVLLIAILLLVPLGSVSANMGVPFGYTSSPINPIVNPKNVISITEEHITFEVSGTTTAGTVFANITYNIVNSGEDGTFTFIFPAMNVYHKGEEFSFKVKADDKEIKYEVKNEQEISNLLKENSEGIEKLLNFDNEVFFDPLTGKEYKPEINIVRQNEKVFFVFDIFLKKNTPTVVNVSFKSFPGIDWGRYKTISILHYYYILDVKDFYKSFDNVKIEIVYPKTYPFKANLEGTVSESSDKNILKINLDGNLKNLSFSYASKKLSKLQILIHRALPFLFGELFFFFLIFVVLPLTVVSIFIAILIIWSNKHFGEKGK
jgi:hypothetical protein